MTKEIWLGKNNTRTFYRRCKLLKPNHVAIYVSTTFNSKEIDEEIGNLYNDNLTIITLYKVQLRDNVKLDENELNSLKFVLTEKGIDSLREMSESKNKELLYGIRIYSKNPHQI